MTTSFQIGLMNSLRVDRMVDFGLYLDAGEEGILLPKRYMPEDCKVGDVLDVFVYRDSENRLIATTETPKAMLWELALLKVVDVNQTGAFLDWGLMKDLFVPFREQQQKMELGQSYVVYLYLDYDTNRIVASARLNRFINTLPMDYEEGEEVDIFLTDKTPLGFKCVVNQRHWGMLFDNEVFVPLAPGMQMKAYVKNIRDDDKLDLQLQDPSVMTSESLADRILSFLKQHNGYLALTDKSEASEIYQQFGESKKNFKKAIGHLYKQKVVEIKDDGVHLCKN